MDKARIKGKDYHKEYKELNKNLVSLKVHVEDRLLELIKKYPEAVVVYNGGDPMLCKQVTKIWFQNLTLEGKIKYIENIEKWSEEKEGVVQLKI